MNGSSATVLRLLATWCTVSLVNSAHAQLQLKVLHSFSGGADGQQPNAALVQAADGVLYGTTYMGGTNNAGTIFKVNPDGSGNTPIYDFANSPFNPFGLSYPSGLIQSREGSLYGTSGFGGTAGVGTVFRINTDGTEFTVLHSFDTSSGYEPTAALIQGRDGTLYGTTQFGGPAGSGTVFKLSTNGTDFAELYVFGQLPDDPRSPQAPLLEGMDGALYGTTSAGGISAVGGASGYGTVYRLNPDGSGEAVLHSFLPSGGDGIRPYGALVQTSDGVLYGTTQEGGNPPSGIGFGTVFRLNPDGTDYRIIHSFDPNAGDGKYPNSALVIGTDGALYGTTEEGGTNNFGVVFRLATAGSDYSVLYHFGSGTNDATYPRAPMVRASDGGLFGTAQLGGDSNFGVIFRLGPAPALISVGKSPGQGGFQISVASAPHFQYRIEASIDQQHWLALTNIYNAAGTMVISDPEAANFPQRFYRAAWVP